MELGTTLTVYEVPVGSPLHVGEKLVHNHLQRYPIYARLPSVNATGTIDFDQLDVEASLYVPLAGIVQQPAEIKGTVKFDTMFISNPVTMFSMFHAEGIIINLAAASTTTSLPTIPWIEILTSPYNLAFNIIFFLGIVLYIAKKKHLRITMP